MLFFNALKCKKCCLPLTPADCVGFHPDGVSGYVYIPCANPACSMINRVALGKTHKTKLHGPGILDVNSKLPPCKYYFNTAHTSTSIFYTSLEWYIKHLSQR